MGFSSPGGAAGAPATNDYLIGTAHACITGEIVVGATPGGELGGTWACPTVDSTHGGSAHHTRGHTIAGACDHTSTAWRSFYGGACGVVTELAFGTSGKVLTSGGACAAPTWETPGTVLVLNCCAPSTQAHGDCAAAGSDGNPARLDHKHAMPAAGGGITHVLGKAADRSITCDSTMTIDACLKFAAAACSSYSFESFALFNSHACADSKMQVSLPTNATFVGMVQQMDSVQTSGPWAAATGCTVQVTAGDANDSQRVRFIGRVETGACAGCVGLQWAQNASNAGATVLKAGSWLQANKT